MIVGNPLVKHFLWPTPSRGHVDLTKRDSGDSLLNPRCVREHRPDGGYIGPAENRPLGRFGQGQKDGVSLFQRAHYCPAVKIGCCIQ